MDETVCATKSVEHEKNKLKDETAKLQELLEVTQTVCKLG